MYFTLNVNSMTDNCIIREVYAYNRAMLGADDLFSMTFLMLTIVWTLQQSMVDTAQPSC